MSGGTGEEGGGRGSLVRVGEVCDGVAFDEGWWTTFGGDSDGIMSRDFRRCTFRVVGVAGVVGVVGVAGVAGVAKGWWCGAVGVVGVAVRSR